jgi:hypothetical protein
MQTSTVCIAEPAELLDQCVDHVWSVVVAQADSQQ